MSGQGRAGQGRAGQGRAGQGRGGVEHFLDRGRKGRRKIGWKEGKGGRTKKEIEKDKIEV